MLKETEGHKATWLCMYTYIGMCICIYVCVLLVIISLNYRRNTPEYYPMWKHIRLSCLQIFMLSCIFKLF